MTEETYTGSQINCSRFDNHSTLQWPRACPECQGTVLMTISADMRDISGGTGDVPIWQVIQVCRMACMDCSWRAPSAYSMRDAQELGQRAMEVGALVRAL